MQTGRMSFLTRMVTGTLLIVLFLAIPIQVSAANSADLSVGMTGAFPWAVSGIVPGTSGSTIYELHNSGTQAGTLYIWVSDIREVDQHGGGTALQNYMYFNVSHPRLQSSVSLPAHIAAFPAAPMSPDYIIVPHFSPGETLKFNWTWEFRETGMPQNEAQNASLWFNITYTLVTVPPPTTPPTPSPTATTWPGGGGGGDGGGGGYETPVPTPLPTGTGKPVITPPQPPSGRCFNVTRNYTTGFEGIFYNSDNEKTLDLDLRKVRAGRTNVTLYPDHIDVYHDDTAGGVLFRFWVDTSDIKNTTRIVKKVNGAELWTDPFTGNLSTGPYTGSVHAIPALIIPPSYLRVTLSDCIVPVIQDEIRNVCAQDHRELLSIPYAMDVERFNLTIIGEANVTMTVPSSWVDRYGGKDAVSIARYGDENGKTELLNSTLLGSDAKGNLYFRGDSPFGRSLYPIFSCSRPAESLNQEPVQTTVPVPPGLSPDYFVISIILILLILLLIGIAAVLIRRRKKKT